MSGDSGPRRLPPTPVDPEWAPPEPKSGSSTALEPGAATTPAGRSRSNMTWVAAAAGRLGGGVGAVVVYAMGSRMHSAQEGSGPTASAVPESVQSAPGRQQQPVPPMTASGVHPGAPPQLVPSVESPDLGLQVPISRPACDGTGIVVLGSAYTPGQYRQQVERMLSLNPGASYLRTDLACPSLAQEKDGNPIYAVYRVAGKTVGQVCAAVAAAGDGTYGRWLSDDSEPETIEC